MGGIAMVGESPRRFNVGEGFCGNRSFDPAYLRTAYIRPHRHVIRRGSPPASNHIALFLVADAVGRALGDRRLSHICVHAGRHSIGHDKARLPGRANSFTMPLEQTSSPCGEAV